MSHPQLLHTVLDAVDVRREAEFWRELLGLAYRPGDEVPEGDDDLDWLVLTDAAGGRVLAFQQVAEQTRTTWPSQEVPMQLHLDLTVATATSSPSSTRAPWRWAPPSCSTAPTTRTSRSTSSPTPRATPSASSSPEEAP